MWLILIVLHAAAGLSSFASGLVVLSPMRAKQRVSILYYYLTSLVALLIFMVAATVSHWQKISGTERILFPGLAVLAVYMLYRGLRAKNLLHHDPTNISDYVSDIGFTLISLFNGFVTVMAIDLKAPIWAVVTGAISAALVGNWLVERAKTEELQHAKSKKA